RCIDTQLYLQHDMTLAQLAKSIGTNRYYLSQYFSSLDMNYNTYINDLRINHFVGLYREALDTQRSFTVQQLALESGYRSYSTFSDVIKRKTGKSVRAWMKEFGEP
ncbi:MAG: AraC family transcriptional regulator, partial [Prevotella sp.]|nr:AraC family transcriptional regulator [Prevotella sp.]